MVAIPQHGFTVIRKARFVICPSCRHLDRASVGLFAHLAAVFGHARTCAYGLGDEADRRRSEPCGCADPVHARGRQRP